MRHFLLVLVILTSGQLAAQVKTSPRELLVKLKSQPTVRTPSGLAKRTGVPSLDAIGQQYTVERIRPLFHSGKKYESGSPLDRVLKITVSDGLDLQPLLEAYENDPNVEYAQLNHVYRLDHAPDDPRLPDQQALQLLRAVEAWEKQLAAADLVVGIIDTGIDYTHEDLRDAIWINESEDLNSNGRLDEADLNGIDDDGNGFIDDVHGWDFTDAPAFPDGGDYRDADSDPFDDNGHGTSVAGLIGASGDNGLGIAGLAYGCRLMNLRAGTSLGFLEEDDVASAIVYAVENGAKVINMSFGDKVASPLLQDVIRFAYAHNCVFVASAGNSSTSEIHFPSGFSETLSVGATNLSDQLAGFSNYGSSVDLVAPGVDLLTTKIGNAYAGFSGTSASAPLVSALAALILSQNPGLNNEAVRGLLVSTTVDLGARGWDPLFAAGRIDALAALQAPAHSIARIDHPEVGQGFSGSNLTVRGTAAGAFLVACRLEVGEGETPDRWTELTRIADRQIIDEPIWELELGDLAEATYTLRLIVETRNGSTIEDKVPFFVDRSAPVISGLTQTELIDADRHAVLLEFNTDDLCDAIVYYRPQGSAASFSEKALRFRAREHRTILEQTGVGSRFEYYVEVVNQAGLTTVHDDSGSPFEVTLAESPVGGAPVEILAQSLPSSFLLNKATDLNGDGRLDVVINSYDDSFNFGPLKIFGFDGGQFVELGAAPDVLIPRDIGDADGDGLVEILGGRGGTSFILEAPHANELPLDQVWTADVWASRFSDLDRDGIGEIIVRSEDTFGVWETTGDNSYAIVAFLTNPTEGTNFTGAPRSEVADFDGDGHLEILLGDFDGDVYTYENRGDNTYAFTWSDRQPLLDAIDYLSTGDYDGDGQAEFAVGSHSDPSLNTESQFDSRHWRYRIYNSRGNDAFEVVWEQAFLGFQSPLTFDAGVASGDVDHDGRDELLINVFPDFYIVDYLPDSGYELVWHAAPNRSNSTLVADLDRDGLTEFHYNDGVQARAHRFSPDFAGPETPLGLTARAVDSTAIALDWVSNASVDGFRIYRGPDPGDLSFLAFTPVTTYVDTGVNTGVTYWYAVTSMDSSLQPEESLRSAVVSSRPGARPFLVDAYFMAPRHIQVRFSKVMTGSVTDHTRYEIRDIGQPTSAVLVHSGRGVLLTSPAPLSAGTHQVTVRSVFDLNGAEIDSLRSSLTFAVPETYRAPYLVRAVLVGAQQLQLEFSQPLDPASVGSLQNFTITPNVDIVSARLSEEDTRLVNLTTNSSTPIGPFGTDYIITVKNIRSVEGETIRPGEGDVIALAFSRSDLSEIYVYPNPYRAGASGGYVTIAGLTPAAKIRILDAGGRLIRTLEEKDGNGGVRWDLRNDVGVAVPSGIYLFYVVSEGSKGLGKLAILR